MKNIHFVCPTGQRRLSLLSVILSIFFSTSFVIDLKQRYKMIDLELFTHEKK